MMRATHEVYDDRKAEIEFYFSVMADMDDSEKDVIHTIDNQRFFRIMKSNFLLMLYNLVEATFTTGILEIYEQVNKDQCSYESLIDELQTLWRDYQIREVYSATSGLVTYTNRMRKVVNDITQKTPLILRGEMLDTEGNLNAKKIKEICDKHQIRYRLTDDRPKLGKLDEVKRKRNSLAHGEESFSRCARNLTLQDLELTKNIVLRFIGEILDGMEKYCSQKLYLRT